MDMFWKPIESRDPLILSAKAIAWRDPTGSGNKKDRKWLLLPVAVLAVGLIAAAMFLPRPADTSQYCEQLEEAFVQDGMSIYNKVEIYTGADPYAGYTHADDTWLWFIGSAPEYDGGDSYSRNDAVWSGFYGDPEVLDEIAAGFSDDGSRLELSNGSVAIGENSDRRVYRGKNVLVYYEGGESEIYEVLEKLFGEPIADGRLETSLE